jgi:hypothetical protein
MHKFLLLIFFTWILFACKQTSSHTDLKVLDFGLFTIETPKSWTKVNMQGTDSYVGDIATDNKDTLSFDLGLYSNKLYETDPTILDSSFMKNIDTTDQNFHSIIFVKNSRLVDLDKYRNNNISWDTIDGREAKIVYPRRSGVGVTGIYIDSLWSSRFGLVHFNLYGENLTPENEQKVLKALRTLKFHKK